MKTVRALTGPGIKYCQLDSQGDFLVIPIIRDILLILRVCVEGTDLMDMIFYSGMVFPVRLLAVNDLYRW